MAIDLNREPYFDDYDPEKGFYKILFRPARAVQVRELNQIQSIIQNQIEQFGNHVFREGSLVLGGAFDLQRRASYVRIETGSPLDEFIGKEIEGTDSGLRAFVLTGTVDENDGATVLFVRYLNSNEFDENVFRSTETIGVDGTTVFANISSDNPTGEGSIFSIDEGVVFVRGYFVQFPNQTIILDKYSTVPTLAIGFRVSDPIIDAEEDSSLYDNAQGAFNFAAPGADRLLLSMTLDSVPLGTADSDSDFTLLAEVEGGLIAESNERTDYARIYEEIAKRTSDESGDYYVRGMTVRTREALDTGENEGLDPNGDSEKLSVDIEPGLAYVKGYEINNQKTKHEIIDKGIDFKFVDNAIVTARTGGYIVINEIVGQIDTDEAEVINFYDSAEQRVTNDTNVSATPTGNIIGTARVKTVAYDSGEMGTPDGSLYFYIFDINMDPGFVISDAKAVSRSGFFADISESLSENIGNTLIYKLGTESTRKIRSKTQFENSTDTSYQFYTTRTATIAQNTKTISVTSAEPLAYSIGTLSQLERREILVSVNNALGAPNNLEAGAHLDLSDPSVTVTVTSNTTFTIDLGDTFDSIGSSVAVTVTYKARRSAIFESAKTLVPNVYVKIGLDQPNAPDINGPISLGFADVYKIRAVYRLPSDGGADPFVDEEIGDDVTDQFRLDNGQKDNYYGHSMLRPRGIALNSDDWLLVKLDYFNSDTHSYFSVDSYPVNDEVAAENTIFTYQIPTYKTSTGEVYELRDSLDFRPVKESTATETTDVVSATINPVDTNDFIANETTNKLLIPLPSSRIELDYSYFLARRDVITLDQNGNFGSVRGKPSLSPVTPPVPENLMAIANVFIPPYPSISQTFARTLGLKTDFCTHERVARKRFTMRDIGVLKDRIENLEYYNALNLLEKETSDLQILDEFGNDRFKNGFLAEGFLDHSLGDTTNDDYNIAVDKVEQTIRPTFEMDSFGYEYLSNRSSLDKIGNLVHLPVEEEVVAVEQNTATTIRNVEQSVYRFLGNLELDPDNDTWVDDTVVDKNIEFGNDLDTDKLMFTEWGSWETNVVGYDVSRQAGGWTGLKFRSGSKNSTAQHLSTFSSYAAAKAAARNQASYTNRINGKYANGLLETIEEDQRTGIQTNVTFEKETQELGNFVTDVSVIPYIRPQAINFYASGIKPGTRHYFFFDGEDVTQYIRQYQSVDNPDTFTSEGTPLRSNEFGQIRGVLYLPTEGKRFRTGTKEVVISDNPTDSLEDITSRAEEYFIASGLNVQRQNTTLSTKIPTTASSEEIFETRNRRAVDSKVIGPSCIAYTFEVNVPPEEEGIFVTSLDLFFQQFHPELGFRVQIRELNSGGNITQNVVPYSEVWTDRKILDPGGNRVDNPILQTSEDGTAPTNIEFKAPVFLYNGTSYAVVVSAENINPDTYLWISRIGETDIATQEPVTSRRLTGAIYTTNNGTNWDIVPQADLKFRLYRARFEANQDRVAILKNKPYEYLTLRNVGSTYTNIGETVTGSDRITVSLTSGTVSVDDTVEGQSSNVEGTVLNVNGQVIETTARGLQDGETVNFTSGGSTVATGSITNLVNGKGAIRKFKPQTNEMILEKTNGYFFEDGIIRGDNSGIESIIDSFDTWRYSTTTLKPDFINFQNTDVVFDKKGRLSDTALYSEFEDGNEDNTISFDEEYALLSRSEEIRLFGESANSAELRITMNSNSEYVSPVLDLSRAHSIYVHNLINDDTTGEDEPDGGNLINKYISKTITLADGQDAEDLKVLLSMYRPPSQAGIENDVKVWFRVKNAEDPESINNRPWYEMIPSNNSFSSIDNENDFIENEFNVSSENLDIDGIVSYDSGDESDPITFSTFKQYQVKIGLIGGNSAIVPKVGDLRAIALQL